MCLGSHEQAISGDDLLVEDLVCRHAIGRAEGGVTASLDVADHYSDSLALSSHNDHTIIVGRSPDLKRLDTSAGFECGATVVYGSVIVGGCKCDIFEAAGSDAE